MTDAGSPATNRKYRVLTMMVQTSTDEVPELLARIEQRRANGLDRYDEWWEGVYRIVTGPSREHQRLLVAMLKLLEARLVDSSWEVLPDINVGVDKEDARVPDLAVLSIDVPLTSPAFVSTAELVVEILSPGERPGEKLPFYARWGVSEYIEIDLDHRTVRMLRNRDEKWRAIERSQVVELSVDEVMALLPD
jgi:Uma2 family endonuclease